MTAADWVVIVLGLAAIGWVNWYFFLAGQPTNHAGMGTGDEQRNEHHSRNS